MNIILIGARACGKTTVGKLIATQMLRTFVDLDDAVLREFGRRSVSDVWREAGESAWREAEARAFHQIARRSGQIIALGGGAPMVPHVRLRIELERSTRRAMVCYLECPPSILARRLRENLGDRPSLTGTDPADEVEHILLLRQETYRALADVTVQTGQSSPAEAADQICKLARSFEAQPGNS